MQVRQERFLRPMWPEVGRTQYKSTFIQWLKLCPLWRRQVLVLYRFRGGGYRVDLGYLQRIDGE